MEETQPGFCEANEYDKPEFVDNAPVRWGTGFEDAIIVLCEEAMGFPIVDREQEYIFPTARYVTCHIDGAYLQDRRFKEGLTLHEAKTTNIRSFRSKWGEPGTDRIPADYQAQVQHQMLLTGAERAIVSVLVFPNPQDDFEAKGLKIGKVRDLLPEDAIFKMEQVGFVHGSESTPLPDLDSYAIYCQETEKIIADPLHWARMLDQMGYFHQYHVNRDQAVIDKMLDYYLTFWEEYVEKCEPPPAINESDAKNLFRNPVGEVLATEEMERLSSERKLIKEEIKSANERVKELNTALLGYMNEKSVEQGDNIDDDFTEKCVLVNDQGFKLNSYNGKQFR
jgi:predicted phage-related endonuclease